MATPKTLIQRFTHGNFADLSYFSPEADFFVGGPARQRELVALAKTQVALTRDAATALQESVDEVATVIRHELELQTDALSNMISQGADRIVNAVDDLASRVSAELAEIRWQLVQLRSTNEQILQVLKRPRGTEAQELLQQGIRNLVNDKLEQAEERFIRALDLDHTDYQVLMNLSYVELRKGNAKQAALYLKDALILPADLDKSARAEALWRLARLHYAEANYRAAADLAKESLSLVSVPRRLFQYGEYLVLATEARQGFSTIEAAIRSDPRLFGLAAISSDLASYGEQVRDLLSSLAIEVKAQLRTQRGELLLQHTALGSLPLVISGAVMPVFRQQVDGLSRVLDQSSYSELRMALSHASQLHEVLPGFFTRFSNIERELRSASEQHDRASGQLANAEAALALFPSSSEILVKYGCGGAFVGGVAAIIVGLVVGQWLGSSLGQGIATAVFLMILLGLFFGLFLTFVADQPKRTKLEIEAREARKYTKATETLLANAKSKWINLASEVSLPAWPLAARWPLPCR